jgi:hypothetical protein
MLWRRRKSWWSRSVVDSHSIKREKLTSFFETVVVVRQCFAAREELLQPFYFEDKIDNQCIG